MCWLRHNRTYHHVSKKEEIMIMKKFHLPRRNRVDFMDIGKFFAIIFVVLIHVLQRTLGGFTGKDGWGSVYLLMLAVPPFFFFSGMSYRLKRPLNPLSFIYDAIKRAFFYLLPFIWFIAMRIWFYQQWPTFSDGWDELMAYPVNGLWVCWVMLWISLVVDIGLFISYFFPRLKLVFVSAVLVIGFTVLMILRNRNVIVANHDIAYDYFIIYIPVFLVGYLVGPYLIKVKSALLAIVCFLVGLGALFPIAINNHDIITVDFLEKSQWMMYLASFCSVVCYFGLITFIRRFKFSSILAFLGQFTMETYFLHLILLKNWSRMTLDNNWAVFGMTLALFLLCFANTFGVVLVSYFIPFSHFILFGRHYSFYKFEDRFFNGIKEFCENIGKLPFVERHSL